jgi:hypothetical protein
MNNGKILNYFFVGYIFLNIVGAIVSIINFFLPNYCTENMGADVLNLIIYVVAIFVFVCIVKMENESLSVANVENDNYRQIIFGFWILLVTYIVWHSFILIFLLMSGCTALVYVFSVALNIFVILYSCIAFLVTAFLYIKRSVNNAPKKIDFYILT